ncbi:MAG: SufD family Fe-S cluster assembly protein [Ruminiclostridium sp.]|nr:SufD family Fe-S cluster assembly protein [Ruminiclostridium sp.]
MAQNKVDINLLREIADLEGTPKGAYNIRKNGKLESRGRTENIDIVTKDDPEKPGIDIYIKDGTRNQSVHIPVIITETGLDELVYNDFHIGADCDVVIVAGCGIHNSGTEKSEHDGVHTFYVGENSKVQYVEKHYGEGEGTGERVMNPQTVVYLEKNSSITLDTTQLRGVDSTKRYTKIVVKEGAEAIITEKLLTHDKQKATSEMDVILAGPGASSRVISRSVAQDDSEQIFYPRMIGDDAGFGHVQCDSILMGEAKIQSIPAIIANHPDAQLVHEAAIGRIAGDQLLKLMTLGLTAEEAEEEILNGFLR